MINIVGSRVRSHNGPRTNNDGVGIVLMHNECGRYREVPGVNEPLTRRSRHMCGSCGGLAPPVALRAPIASRTWS